MECLQEWHNYKVRVGAAGLGRRSSCWCAVGCVNVLPPPPPAPNSAGVRKAH